MINIFLDDNNEKNLLNIFRLITNYQTILDELKVKKSD
jgi:hypothetical protein